MNAKMRIIGFCCLMAVVLFCACGTAEKETVGSEPEQQNASTEAKKTSEAETEKKSEAGTEAETEKGSQTETATEQYTTDAQDNRSDVEKAAADYALKFIYMLDKDDETTFRAEDFATIDGYITARSFMWERDRMAQSFQTEIHDINIINVTTAEGFRDKNVIEVAVSIQYQRFDGGHRNNCANDFMVTVEEQDEGCRCIDIKSGLTEDTMPIYEYFETHGLTDYDEQREYVDKVLKKMYEELGD